MNKAIKTNVIQQDWIEYYQFINRKITENAGIALCIHSLNGILERLLHRVYAQVAHVTISPLTDRLGKHHPWSGASVEGQGLECDPVCYGGIIQQTRVVWTPIPTRQNLISTQKKSNQPSRRWSPYWDSERNTLEVSYLVQDTHPPPYSLKMYDLYGYSGVKYSVKIMARITEKSLKLEETTKEHNAI